MKYCLGFFLILQGVTHGQNFTLPSLAADSAYYEVTKGRKCEKITDGLTRENSWLDSVRMAQDEEISLYQDIIESQNLILYDYPKEIKAKVEICQAEKERLKVKIRRLWRVVVTEAGVIVILIILL